MDTVDWCDYMIYKACHEGNSEDWQHYTDLKEMWIKRKLDKEKTR